MILCFASDFAWGQCAPGVQSAGNPSCIPQDRQESPIYQGDRGALGNQSTQPAQVYADRWGAVVIDNHSGQIGVSVDHTSKSDAVGEAMDNCTQTGSKSCSVAATYYNQCVAVAWSKTYHSTTTAAYKNDAEKKSLNGCASGSSGAECKIIYSDCSYAQRIK
ncbi:DUF4189 domain-containing protein [Dyella sp.]|uniref:DUF4189 domain-containing protein n=1 Tax=Dyella sp. TaxID=1869338 RepID=UPI0039C864CD